MSSTPRTYWGGDRVSPATVYPLKAETFKEFVKNYVHTAHPLKVRREEFLSWDKDKRDAFKDGPYFVSVAFKEGTTRRKGEFAERAVLVCLDIDDPDLARDFVECPEVLADALYPYSFVAFTTATHRPESPRLRVVVDIEPCAPEDRRKHVLHVARLLGFPAVWSGLTESCVPVQAMYRPAIFEGETVPPVIVSRTDGVPLTALDIPADIEAEEASRTYAHAYRGADDDLLNLPIRDLKPEDIREPLAKIDPDITHKEWCEIICGLLFQFRDEESAEEAFRIFDEWSSGGEKYRGEEKTFAKWRSFKPDFGGRRPVTIRSLFFHAIAAGWDSKKLATRYKANFAEWVGSVEDPDELLAEGYRRISDMPFKNDMVDEAMFRLLAQRIQKTGGGQMSISTIRKAVHKLRNTTRQEEEKKNDNKPAWLLPWCYVRTLDEMYNTVTGVALAPEAFNRAFGHELMPVNPEDDAARAGKPAVMPVDFLLNVKKHDQVDRKSYDPRKGSATEPFFTHDGQKFVNLYRFATVPAPDPRTAAMAMNIIRCHLEVLFPGDLENQLVMLDWMAFQAQFPGVKIRWVPCIQGAEGCGKTFLVRIVGAAIGSANVNNANPSTIKQGWNDWAVSAQLVAIEEIWVAGKGRMDILNSLKDIITNDYVVVNRRNKDPYTIEHVTNYVAFTNHHDALPIQSDDRRWYILKCGAQTKADVARIKDKVVGKGANAMRYFERLAALVNKHSGGIRQALLDHPVRPSFNPNDEAPQTIYRTQMVESAKNPLHLAIEDFIRSGEHPMISRDLILYDDVVNRTLPLAKQNHPPSHFLYKMGFQPHRGSERYQVNGSRSQVWVHAEHYDAEFFGDPVAELKRRHDLISDESI